MRLRWIALGWLWLATSCDENVGGAEKDEQRARETALEELTASICAQVEACDCSAGELAAGELSSGCTTLESDLWRARLKVGHDRALVWDGDCVDAIGEAVGAAACEEAQLGLSHPCNDYCAVFHGEREIGESCEGFDELVSDCAQGLLCAQGRCVAPCTVLSGGQPGEPCGEPGGAQEFGACAQGLYCDRSLGRCAVPPPVGSPCEDYDDCGPDAFCDWDVAVCRALPGLGASCWESPQCIQGLACQNSPDYGSATCVEPAAADEDCRDRPCAEGLSCDVMLDECVPTPAIGEPCVWGSGCGEGAMCDDATNTCVAGADAEDPDALGPPGTPCNSWRQCRSGSCPAGFCAALPGPGEPCSLGCADGFECSMDTFTCVEPAPSICTADPL